MVTNWPASRIWSLHWCHDKAVMSANEAKRRSCRSLVSSVTHLPREFADRLCCSLLLPQNTRARSIAGYFLYNELNLDTNYKEILLLLYTQAIGHTSLFYFFFKVFAWFLQNIICNTYDAPDFQWRRVSSTWNPEHRTYYILIKLFIPLKWFSTLFYNVQLSILRLVQFI